MCGVVVRGDGGFVVDEDATEEVGGFVVVAASGDVSAGRLSVAEFACFCAVFVDVGMVGVASAGHGDVKQIAAGVLAENGEAGVGGDSLGGVHGNGVAEADVLAEIVLVEGGAGFVIEAFASDATVVGVDDDDPPPVSVAH